AVIKISDIHSEFMGTEPDDPNERKRFKEKQTAWQDFFYRPNPENQQRLAALIGENNMRKVELHFKILKQAFPDASKRQEFMQKAIQKQIQQAPITLETFEDFDLS